VTTKTILDWDWFPGAVPENVEIGRDSWLYSAFSFLHFRSRRSRAVRIGNSSGVYDGSFFDLGPHGSVEIGNYCTLVGVIMATDGDIRIGDYCFLAHEVVIADAAVAIPWRDTSPSDGSAVAFTCVTLGDNVWVGAGAVLLRGARLGRDSIVGAGAVVDFEVPPGGIVAGNPARLVGRVR
jgi:acetyltransferase-like isoleucine patch superfamily enzyme